MRRSLAVAILATFAFPVAAGAQGSAPAPAQRTVSATGIARVLVAKPAKRNEASIQAVVDAADRAAEAKAIRVAGARAASYAANTGLTLGPLFSVDEGDFGIFGSFALIEDEDEEESGLGPFCRPRERYDRRRRRTITRTICSVPESRLSIVRLTYTIAG